MKLYLDFEYNHTAEAKLNLVCCSTLLQTAEGWERKRWWLHKDPAAYEALATYLARQADFGAVFYSWSVEAEARSVLSLGIDPVKFKWVDLYLEYRMLQNHNHDLLYGMQLLDGKVKRTFPYGEKGKANLAAATYKLLKKTIDTEHKTKMRDLIISSPEDFTDEERKAIMDYCESDTENLPALAAAIGKYYPKVIPKEKLGTVRNEALLRGEYSARTAKMVALGYPVNTEWLNNFSSNVQSILETCQRDINRQFPGNEPFRYNKARKTFSLYQQVVKDWIEARHRDDWERTDGGGISLALESFTKKYNYQHDYPEGHLAAQMVRFLKLKQAMNGFNPNAEKTIFNYLGTDGRVRPYLNPYGAQSSRTQPASTAFIFLKPAWQRAMVQPRPGRAIAGIDWSSVEFLLSGLLSGDERMLAAYASGDVYLAFGKMIGWIPQDGTKNTHKFERNCCKALVLGLSYLMSKYGLAHKLTEDTGKVFTEDEAQELVEQFEETFQTFADWREEFIKNYEAEGHVRLPCGWYMFGDNDNFRSVGNVPVQGMCATIMRKAVALAQDRGLDVIFTLHDAIYIEYNSGDLAAIDTLKECMDEAFTFYFTGAMKEKAKLIRCEAETWSPDYKSATAHTPKGFEVRMEEVHIDERATKEYALFSKYFFDGLGDDLL